MFTFRKDMHPIALVQLFQCEVHRSLIDTIASFYRDGFAQAEEALMLFHCEHNIIGSQCPTHAFTVPKESVRQRRSYKNT